MSICIRREYAIESNMKSTLYYSQLYCVIPKGNRTPDTTDCRSIVSAQPDAVLFTKTLPDLAQHYIQCIPLVRESSDMYYR